MKQLKLGYWSLVFLLAICQLVLYPVSVISAPLNVGYLWHLHQPMYWPGPISSQQPRMERAWETIQRQDQGRQHPQPEKLRDIFL